MVLVKLGIPLEGEKPVVMVEVAGDIVDESDTDWVDPLKRDTVTVVIVLPPWITVALLELTLIEKSKVEVKGAAFTAA